MFTILTKEPTTELRRIHDRMPLMLPKELIDEWINPKANPKDLLQYTLNSMVIEKSV